MSFWDNVKKFAQPYADEDYDDDYEDDVDDYEEEEEVRESAPRSRRGADVNSDYGFSAPTPAATPSNSASGGFSGTVLNSSSSSKQEVVLFRPVSFNDTSKAADFLRAKKAVVVNMENVDKAMARRVVDFLSGCAYSLDGKVKKIAQSTYLFCPYHMEVTGDLENLQSEVESYI